MTTNTQFVVAGTIARNRAWILTRWHAAIVSGTVQPQDVHVHLNDSDDDSEDILISLECQRSVSFHTNTGGYLPGSERAGDNPRSISHMAHLRNIWIDQCLARYPNLTHLWSVDSDILPAPDVLELLLAADKPVIAAVVRNSTALVWNFFHGMEYAINGSNELRLFRDRHEVYLVGQLDSPFRVTMTGACCLYRRDALDAGLRFHHHPQGEDVGLSVSAHELGIPLYVHPRAHTLHYMSQIDPPLDSRLSPTGAE